MPSKCVDYSLALWGDSAENFVSRVSDHIIGLIAIIDRCGLAGDLFLLWRHRGHSTYGTVAFADLIPYVWRSICNGLITETRLSLFLVNDLLVDEMLQVFVRVLFRNLSFLRSNDGW